MAGLLAWFPTTILGNYMFKVDNKNTRAKYEMCLTLKLNSKYTGTALSNGVVVFIVNFEGIRDFEHLKTGWKCCVSILTIAIQVAVNSPESLIRTSLFLQ